MPAEPPIHTIPSEILGNIFTFAVYQPWVVGDVKQRVSGARTVVVLSHVCRLWRNVSLSLPTLWSTVDDQVSERLSIFIQRSNRTPLRVQVRELVWTPSPAMQDLLDRVRFLDIALTSVQTLATAKIRMPHLECLLLEVYCRDTLTYHVAPSDSGVNLFAEPTPSLQALSLNRPAATLLVLDTHPTSQFPNLIHLHLSVSAFRPSTVDLRDMFGFLRLFPRLHTLHFSAGDGDPRPLGPLPRQTRDAELPVTAMPSLRRVWFSRWHLPSAFFLASRLTLGAECKVGFGRCMMHPDDITQPTFPCVVPAPSGIIDDVALALGKGNVHLTAHGARGGLWIGASGPQRTRTKLWSAGWIHSLLLSTFRRADVRTLRVHMENARHLPSLHAALRAMPEMRALDLSGDGSGGFVTVVLAEIGAPQALFPLLETLAVDLSGLGEPPLSYVRLLVQSAQNRAERGARLRRVVLKIARARSGETEEFGRFVGALEQCVEEVEVLAGERCEPSQFAVDRRWTDDDHGYWEAPEEDRPAVDTSWMRWGK